MAGIVIIGFGLLIAGIVALTAWLFTLAWNFLGASFGWPVITIWHSLAAMLLLSIVGSFFRGSK